MKIPTHESFRIGALLAVVGGFLDAYTYILQGGVFANAQTGNIVLLAVNLAEGQFSRAMYFIMPIAAFVAGVFVTQILKVKLKEISFLKWEHIIIWMEIVLLAIIGFLPDVVPHQFVNVTISFICSIQVNSFPKLHNINYASTMCTGNLRSGAENLFRRYFKQEQQAGRNAVHYFGIIFFFMIGAAAGTMLSHTMGTKSIWACCIILGVVFLGLKEPKKIKDAK